MKTDPKVVIELDCSIQFPVIIKTLQLNAKHRWQRLDAQAFHSISLKTEQADKQQASKCT